MVSRRETFHFCGARDCAASDTLRFVLPEVTATRKVEYTPEGVSVELRSPLSKRVAQVIGQAVAVAIGVWILRGGGASLSRLAAGDSLEFPFDLLEGLALSPATMRWIVYAVLAIAGYTVVAGTYVIFSRLTRRDRILIGAGEWQVERRALGISRRTVVAVHESVGLEFDAFESALIARTPERKVTITNLGTMEDRAWLKSELDKKGAVSPLQNVATGDARVVRTVRLEKRADGSLFIADTKAARYGCPVIMLILAVAIAGAALRFQSGGWWVAVAAAGFITVLFWIGSGDMREATVVRGSIHLRWVAIMRRRPGTARRGEKTIRSSILYMVQEGNSCEIRTVDLETGYPITETVVTLTGSNCLPDAQLVLEAIARESGFPLFSEAQARDWITQKIAEYDAAYEDEEMNDEGEEGIVVE